MQNLDQIRARNALRIEKLVISGENDGEVIKKIPPVILNHGFLAAAAYAFDPKKSGWKSVFDEIAKHLSDPSIKILPPHVNSNSSMVEHLTSSHASSDLLRRVTSEAMAWLNFARRFSKHSNK